MIMIDFLVDRLRDDALTPIEGPRLGEARSVTGVLLTCGDTLSATGEDRSGFAASVVISCQDF